jgi:hypothetical protein
MSPARWKKFSDLAQQVDLGRYDLTLTAQKRGYGMDLSYSVVPDVEMRKYWTAEQKAQLGDAVKSFYEFGEGTLVNPMSFNEWNVLLVDLGFDLQNGCWPGGMNPFTSGVAMGAVRGAVGYGPAQHGMVGGTLMAPPPAPAGYAPSSAPQAVLAPQQYAQGPAPASVGYVPAQAPAPAPAPAPQSAQVASHVATLGPAQLNGVPLGTAPSMPVSSSVGGIPAPSVPASNLQNEVANVAEISEDEFKQMLS